MRHYNPTFFVLMFSLILLSTEGVFGDEIKIFTSPSSLTMDGSGVESTIEVKIEGTEEISSIKTFEVFLSYNPKVLEVVEVKEGALFVRAGHPTFWYFYQKELGEHIHIVDAILGNGLDVEADGTLFSVKFKSLGNGISNLDFEQVKIGVLSADKSKVLYVPSISKGNGKITVGTESNLKVDINDDGIVDILDLVLVGREFGNETSDSDADVNKDGVVDISDLVLVARHFGKTFPTADAPKRNIGMSEETNLGVEKSKKRAILKSIPKENRLFNNYPNPFNPETWLPYQLATDTTVTIRIYDVKGQLVRQLDLGSQKAGSYLDKGNAAYWDGKDQTGQAVSSGIYFYTLKAGDFHATRRMVILK